MSTSVHGRARRLVTVTGLDPFGPTSSLPGNQARAEGLGLLSLDAASLRSNERSLHQASSRHHRPVIPAGYPRSMSEPTSLYERAGGTPFFEALVARFYTGVETDPLLRAIYPEADLAPARRRLTLFLIQYWGGPTTYDEERGHPRLRMRHAPFAIGPQVRDRWLRHMRAAIADLAPSADIAGELERYIAMAAEAMRNRD